LDALRGLAQHIVSPVGVDLGRRDLRMTEKLSDHGQREPALGGNAGMGVP
jgi:hypothetical protein